ncbi:hypothetical protein E2P81_ATG05854 [Venturia nashicola]|uniref:Uncharacterized protein n=1 Tax=Venturia nashicola TaxID=86259 RepID=A0A4Z1P478_9PEZI|nr:hypothetical protein E6O75_ATG06001 [Venturia nashicola]TLD29560.1 hypothetical protein E2P81_ATG05854 [Venturia nashicola]
MGGIWKGTNNGLLLAYLDDALDKGSHQPPGYGGTPLSTVFSTTSNLSSSKNMSPPRLEPEMAKNQALPSGLEEVVKPQRMMSVSATCTVEQYQQPRPRVGALRTIQPQESSRQRASQYEFNHSANIVTSDTHPHLSRRFRMSFDSRFHWAL